VSDSDSTTESAPAAEGAPPPSRTDDFRLYLTEVLEARCRKNPRYSLRAFAHAIGTDYSTLAKMLAGKRVIGPRIVERIGRELGLGSAQIARFVATARRQAARPSSTTAGFAAVPPTDGEPASEGAPYTEIDLAKFKVVSEWYHLAIMELLAVRGAQASPQWMAGRLGIAVVEAKLAIDRLVTLGWLARAEDGALRDLTSGRTSVMPKDDTEAALRNYQKQVLAQATAAVDDTPFALRDHSTVTMAIDSSRLALARAEIKRFRRRLAALLRKGGDLDHVYQLSIALFPVSNRSEPS
jgi:uncharacterized protein (TIGR02147 family)